MHQSLDEKEPIKSMYHEDETYASLLKDFGRSLAQRLAELKVAVSEANWYEVSKIAHKINGAAATYGYPMLSERAREVEVLARQLYSGQKVLNDRILYSKIMAINKLCERVIAGC